MIRKLSLVLMLAGLLASGCAGPSKLAERSEEKLAGGEMWRAWTLATKALDKAPGNERARAAAGAAADAIAADWQRRIHALADVDTVAAAEQALEFTSFRADAVRYTTVAVEPAWAREEQGLRQGAARLHYQRGATDLESRRPKRAYLHFVESERFVPNYRDAARLADRAFDQAQTRVAFVPLAVARGGPGLGRDVATSWRGDVAEHLSPPGTHFTRILPVEDVERMLSVGDLGRLSRDAVVRLGRRAGADRVVWGSIGAVDAKTSVHVFADVVARRIVENDPDGHPSVRWVEVPIEVIARVRTVTADLEYEVIATRGGATLARRHEPRTISARVVWTAYSPVGSPDAYALVSEPARAADPERAKRVETRWKAALGDRTSLAQVLEAKRSHAGRSHDRREDLGRLAAGAAFVLLEDLPSTEELALAALAGGWQPVYEDLLKLDPVDDVDLGLAAASAGRP
jgi:hypothetical protein